MHILRLALLLSTLNTDPGPALSGTQNLIIDGFIDDTTLGAALSVVEQMPAQVNVLINSPGGSAVAAETITNIFMFARANGVHITCVVNGKAMSAAFWILESCSDRFATPGSQFMTHSAFIVATGEIVLTIGRLQDFLAELLRAEQSLAATVGPRMGMTPQAFRAKLKEHGIEGWRFDVPGAIILHAIDAVFTKDVEKFVPPPKVPATPADVPKHEQHRNGIAGSQGGSCNDRGNGYRTERRNAPGHLGQFEGDRR